MVSYMNMANQQVADMHAPMVVKSGVPQDTVLGPIMFLLLT